MDIKRRILPFLIVLAIVSSAISPACAFISGTNQSFIEICTGVGNKSVPDPHSQTDAAPDMTQNQCEFCFHAQSLNAIDIEIATIQTMRSTADFFGYLNEIALLTAVKGKHARAPPALFFI